MRAALAVGADRGDDRDVVLGDVADDADVDALDPAHEADVLAARALHRADAEQQPVVAAEPDRGLPVAAEAQHDVLVDLADEDHLGDLDGLLVADPQPADELDRHVEALHVARDVRPAAVDDDRVQPDVLEQHDVARELLAQRRVVIAAPPYLMTTVLPWNSRMYGSASRSACPTSLTSCTPR